ncbi:MAG: hypothetical protein M1840_004291 [Geoglossum simile]|nr:MAG: hypothetical protein M1840_004291 [Geoglossum simile]
MRRAQKNKAQDSSQTAANWTELAIVILALEENRNPTAPKGDAHPELARAYHVILYVRHQCFKHGPVDLASKTDPVLEIKGVVGYPSGVNRRLIKFADVRGLATGDTVSDNQIRGRAVPVCHFRRLAGIVF